MSALSARALLLLLVLGLSSQGQVQLLSRVLHEDPSPHPHPNPHLHTDCRASELSTLQLIQCTNGCSACQQLWEHANTVHFNWLIDDIDWAGNHRRNLKLNLPEKQST